MYRLSLLMDGNGSPDLQLDDLDRGRVLDCVPNLSKISRAAFTGTTFGVEYCAGRSASMIQQCLGT